MFAALTVISMLCAADPNATTAEPAPLLDHVVFDALGSTSFQAYVNGKTYETRVPIEALARTPKWNDTDENPPLSARKAMKLAGDKAPEFQAIWSLTGLENRWEWHTNGARLCRSGPVDWCWVFSYVARSKTGTTTGTPMAFRMIVLMDGTVFGPEIVKDSSFGDSSAPKRLGPLR